MLFKVNAHLLKLVLITVHDSDAQNELLSVVIVEDAVEIVSETL